MKSDLESVLSSVPPYDLNDRTVVVFGAGNTSLEYQDCFEREGIRPVYYVDNAEAKQNTVFHGVPVISVEKLVSLRETFGKPVLVLICSLQIAVCNQISSQLKKYGLACTPVDAVVFKKNADKIRTVCDLLADDFSRDVYIQVLQSRINSCQVPEPFVNVHDQYFLLPPFRDHSEKEVFVDLGAYVGDTVEQYLNIKTGAFGKIYAFEPDTVNFSVMERRLARLKSEWGILDDKITLVDGGIGSKVDACENVNTSHARHESENQQSYSGATLVTARANNTGEIKVYTIDDYFKEQYVSFIKADIESYELDMLTGAESVIKRDKPLLAVCIYHTASDLFTIPLFIKELCGDYKFKIRHHTYALDETVLYAYV